MTNRTARTVRIALTQGQKDQIRQALPGEVSAVDFDPDVLTTSAKPGGAEENVALITGVVKSDELDASINTLSLQTPSDTGGLDSLKDGDANCGAADQGMSLATLLHPFPESDFIGRHWNREFKFVNGEDKRFECLLPWTALNDILDQHRLDEPRLRVVKEGRALPATRYLSYVPDRHREFVKVPILDSVAMNSRLQEGATLIVDSVEEAYPPLRRLVENLERRLRARVQVNAYAGFRSSRGFNIHWDDQDVIILQVYGRKHWRVYPATRAYPLSNDIEPNLDPPTDLIFEGTLTSGDVLYIPRGVWHVALPLDEPALHLTLAFSTITGVDFFNWMVAKLRAMEIVRLDLPKLGTAKDQEDHQVALRNALDDLWTPEILTEYLEELELMEAPRRRCSLPSLTP